MADYKESEEYIEMKRSMEAFSEEVSHYPEDVLNEDKINALAVETCGDVRSFTSLMSVMQDADNATKAQNDAALEREGFTREDVKYGRAPAYVEDMLYAEHEPYYYDHISQDAVEDFYNTAVIVDFVFTDETKTVLGPAYNAYARIMMTESKESDERLAKIASEQADGNQGKRRLPDIPDTGNAIDNPETGLDEPD